MNPVGHPDLVIQKLYDDKIAFWHAGDLQNPNQNIYSGDAVLICDPDLMQTQWLLKQIHKSQIKYRRMITSSSLDVIASLTAHGAGVGILPTSVTLSLYPEKLLPVQNMPTYQDEICLAYRHENRYIKAIQAIVHAIKLNFNSKL